MHKLSRAMGENSFPWSAFFFNENKEQKGHLRVDSNAHEPTLEARENTRNSINSRLSPYFSSCWCAHFRMKTVPVCTALPRAFSRKCAVACASFRLFPILLRFFPFLKGSDAPHSSFFCTSSLVKKSERSGASGILFTSSVCQW